MTHQGPPARRWQESFDLIRDRLWALLPAGIRSWLPATVVGYLLINGLTFSLDMGLMSLLYRVVHLPYPMAVSGGYLVALGLAYLLNRSLNFHSHARMAPQLWRYLAVVVLNYTVLVLGGSWLLQHLGVQFQLARVLAACVEAVFMYCCLRWIVFRASS